MITKFKIFESVSVPYKVGDYALIKINSKGTLYNNILCQIVGENEYDGELFIKILDKNFDSKIKVRINIYQLICWSDNKEELEMFIDMKKYNL